MRVLPAVLAASALALGAAAEDLTIVSKVTPAQGAPKTATSYLSDTHYRHSDGEHDTIVDFQSGLVTSIDHAKKQYYETTREQLAAMAAQANERMKQMQEQAKQNPQVAAMMEKMTGGPLGDVTVQKGTGQKKLAGYACDEYILSMGESVKLDMWVTAELQPPVGMYEARKDVFQGGGPLGERFSKMMEEMKKVKGYPLGETMSFKMGPMQRTTTTEATEVKKGPIAAAAFEVPAGYSKVAAPSGRPPGGANR
jgi:hypothetical protein